MDRALNSRTGDWSIPELGSRPAADDRHHVIVVGAGIGGLTAAALLAKRGKKVLVLEAHDRPGGCCTSWVRTRRGEDGVKQRFVFDAGVQDFSGLGRRGPLRRVLSEIGAIEKIQWRRVRHLYLQEGRRLDLGAEGADFCRELVRLFPDEAVGIVALFEEIEAIYDEMCAGLDAIGRGPIPFDIPERGRRLARWIGAPFLEMLASFVENPALKQFLSTISEYVTDDPACLSALEMIPLFGYYFEGGYYPGGGSQVFADLLSSVVAEHGGRVALRRTVSELILEDGRIAGVQSEGKSGKRTDRAPLVVFNADIALNLKRLLGPETMPQRYAARLAGMKRGPSAILVSLGLDRIPELPARVFLTHDGLRLGVGNPSAIDPTIAPPGCAALTMLRLLNETEKKRWCALDPASYRTAKAQVANEMVSALDTIIPGVRDHILRIETAAPPTFHRYLRTADGCIYGAARGQRLPGVKTPIPGLFAVGGGVQMGPGVEAVVIAGSLVADLIAPAQADV